MIIHKKTILTTFIWK